MMKMFIGALKAKKDKTEEEKIQIEMISKSYDISDKKIGSLCVNNITPDSRFAFMQIIIFNFYAAAVNTFCTSSFASNASTNFSNLAYVSSSKSIGIFGNHVNSACSGSPNLSAKYF